MTVFEKNGAWWIDTYLKGRRVRRKNGRDKELAELVVQDLRVKAAKEEHLGIVETRKVRVEDFALKEYLPWYEATKAPSTVYGDASRLRHSLIPFFHGRLMASITVKDLENYKVARSKVRL